MVSHRQSCKRCHYYQESKMYFDNGGNKGETGISLNRQCSECRGFRNRSVSLCAIERTCHSLITKALPSIAAILFRCSQGAWRTGEFRQHIPCSKTPRSSLRIFHSESWRKIAHPIDLPVWTRQIISGRAELTFGASGPSQQPPHILTF